MYMYYIYLLLLFLEISTIGDVNVCLNIIKILIILCYFIYYNPYVYVLFDYYYSQKYQRSVSLMCVCVHHLTLHLYDTQTLSDEQEFSVRPSDGWILILLCHFLFLCLWFPVLHHPLSQVLSFRMRILMFLNDCVIVPLSGITIRMNL